MSVHEEKVAVLTGFYICGLRGDDEGVLLADDDYDSRVNAVRPNCAIVGASYSALHACRGVFPPVLLC